LGLDLPDVAGRVVARLLGHLLEERPLRLLARHPGRLLEALAHGVRQPVDLAPALLEPALALPERVVALGELRLALRERLDLLIDRLFLLGDPALHRLQLAPLLARLPLGFRLRLDGDVLRVDLGLLPERVALLPRLLDDAGGGRMGARLELRDATAAEPVDQPDGERAD